MTKEEFIKKWAPVVVTTTGTRLIDGWEEDLESMIESETAPIKQELQIMTSVGEHILKT